MEFRKGDCTRENKSYLHVNFNNAKILDLTQHDNTNMII